MKPLTIFLLILLALFGYIAVADVLTPEKTGLFEEFNNLALSFLVILTLITFFIGLRRFKADKKIKHFAITALPGLIICLFIVIKVCEYKSIDQKKTIFKVVNMAGANNVLQFEFKTNNYFRLAEQSMLDQTIYYGTYKLERNLIQITSSNTGDDIPNFPNSGRIKSDTLFWSNFDTMLIEK